MIPFCSIKSQLTKLIYPIGSIYMSVNNTNPSELFGGTWVAWGSGKVPVGVNIDDSDFDTVEKSGGEKIQSLRALIGATNGSTARIGYLAKDKVSGYNYSISVQGSNVENSIPNENINHSTEVVKADGKTPTTVQPYITCYMFKRTS